MKKGLLFIVSAPAGTGKTTLVRMLRDEFSHVVESISFTTRSPRQGEENGRDYHFIDEDSFKRKIQEGDFLEYAEVFHCFYGTSKTFVEEQRAKGQHVVLVIDTQGAMQLKGKCDGIFIFISPPSLEELRQRLENRKADSEESIATRISWAGHEMEMAPHYDYHIINDELKSAYDALRSILIAEEHKTR